MSRQLLVLALTAFCLTKAITGETYTADTEFLYKQKNISELFFYIDQPTIVGSEACEVGRGYDVESNINLYTNKTHVQEFLYLFKYGMLKPRALFSVYYREHRHEVLSLFRLFYAAKDFQTFYTTACWARYNMNEGMFVTAFSTAVMYRPDCKYIQLPPYYEIYPQLFFDSKLIQEVRTIKMMRGLPKGTMKDDVELFRIDTKRISTKPIVGSEHEVDYFTEDVGLNNFYYYFRTASSFWLNSKEINMGLNKIRGEIFYYTHKQLLDRWYIERQSNGLGDIEELGLDQVSVPAYYSKLIYPNGVSVPKRDFWSITPNDKTKYLREIKYIEMHILTAIDSGYLVGLDGKQIGIYTPEGLDLLGNIIEGNSDSSNIRLYGSLEGLFEDIFGFNNDCNNKNCVVPSALQTYSMSLRDPAFYRLYKRIINYFLRYKSNLEPYTITELDFSGVKIVNVNVDKIYTFFENYETIINNAVAVDNWKDGLKINIKAKQRRLNHKIFSVTLSIKSDRTTTSGMVRIFLGVSNDEFDNEYEYFKNNWMNFFELDQFVVTLKPGMNTIERMSNDSIYAMNMNMPTGDVFYKKVLKSIEGSEPFTYTDRVFGFPNNLLIPKGKVGGMAYRLFFYIHPVDENNMTTFDVPMFGKTKHDGRPMGFPLDRPIYRRMLDLSNMFVKDVMIYHLK